MWAFWLFCCHLIWWLTSSSRVDCVELSPLSLSLSLSLSPTVLIGHRSWQVLQTTFSVCIELIYVNLFSLANTGASTCWPNVLAIGECRLYIRSCFFSSVPHVRLTWMVCEMGGKFLYSCCFVDVLLPGFVQNST